MFNVFSNLVPILTETVEDVSRLVQLWEQSKGWILSIGIGTIVLFSTNIGLKIKQLLGNKKITKAIDPILKEQDKANKEMLNLGQGTIKLSKELSKAVEDIAKKVVDGEIQNSNVVKLLVELLTINTALSTSPTELKTQALTIIKSLNLDLKSVNLLEKSIELSNVDEDGKDDLDNIIDSEL